MSHGHGSFNVGRSAQLPGNFLGVSRFFSLVLLLFEIHVGSFLSVSLLKKLPSCKSLMRSLTCVQISKNFVSCYVFSCCFQCLGILLQ